MKIKQFLIILIIFIPVISVQSQDITTLDLDKINVYTIPYKEYKSVSNISLDSDYTLFIIIDPQFVKDKINLIDDYYPYLNHSQIKIVWIFLGRILYYNDYVLNIEINNISSPVCVTEEYTVFDKWRKNGIYVILYDQNNREIIETHNSLTDITINDILTKMNELGITFLSLPDEVSKSIYKPNKSIGFEIGLVFIPLIIIWSRRFLNE